MEKAPFSDECIWGFESFFREVPGVTDAIQIEAGGDKDSLKYSGVRSCHLGNLG